MKERRYGSAGAKNSAWFKEHKQRNSELIINLKMNTMTQHTKNEEFYDMVSLLEYEHEEILISLSELENLVLDLGKQEVDYKKYGDIKELLAKVFKRLGFNFMMEEDILFPELHEVLPQQSSVPAMKTEHTEILELCSMALDMMATKEHADVNKERIEAEIITLTDLVERSFHKKENVMYHEAESLFDERQLEELYNKMLLKYYRSA